MAALEEVVSDEGMYVAAPVALETFLSRYIASLLEPPTPEVVARVEPTVSKPVDPPAAKSVSEPANRRRKRSNRVSTPPCRSTIRARHAGEDRRGAARHS